MSSIDSICEICGRHYSGMRCLRCTQTEVTMLQNMSELLSPAAAAATVPQQNTSTAAGRAVLKTVSGQTFIVSEPVCRIGADDSNDIVLLNDAQVSRFHAQITYRDGEHVLRDLGTKEGTWLNGQRMESEQAVFNGDHLRIGGTRFYFVALYERQP